MISSYVGCWYCGVCVCEFSSGEAVVDLDPSVMTCAGGPRSEVGGSVGHVIRALPHMGLYVVRRRGKRAASRVRSSLRQTRNSKGFQKNLFAEETLVAAECGFILL